MGAPAEVLDLVAHYRRNRATFESDAYLEASARQEFVDPFFRSLGWDVGNRLGWADQNKEVVVEPYVNIDGHNKAPDYAFRVGPQPKFFAEAKRPSIVLRTDPVPARQIRGYGWNAGMPVCILTNFGEFVVYDTSVKPSSSDRVTTARVAHISFDEYDERWEWIESIFGRTAVWKGSLEEFAKAQPTRRGSQPVDAAILAEIEKWREALARELARRNSGLSKDELNAAVQSTIDRVMFLRICEDRNVQPYGELRSAASTKDVYGELLRMFRRADDRYNSGLFHFRAEHGRVSAPDMLTPQLTIGNRVLADLLFDLYPPLSPFDFRFIGVEVLGQVYEEFLGKVIRLDASRRVIVEEKPEVKKAHGVVYTPESVVRYIIGQSLEKALAGTTLGILSGRLGGRKAHPLRVLDPACGSGSFLIAVYQTLLDWYYAEYTKNPSEHVKGRNPALRPVGQDAWQLTTTERKRILLDHVFGVDIDPQAVEVTKLSLLLKCLEGETDTTIHQQMTFLQERALPDLDNNIKCGNSLIGIDYAEVEPTVTADPTRLAKVNMFDWGSEFPSVFAGPEPGFDVVLGNPPYVLLQDEFRDDLQLDYFRKHYSVAAYKLDTYHLFLERSLQVVHEEGWLSMITPSNWLTNNYLVGLRSLLLDSSCLESVTVLDRGVFPKRSVDCAVLATRAQGRTEKPLAMLHAVPAPHQSLAIVAEKSVDPARVRSDAHLLFTGTAEPKLALALDALEMSGLVLGDIARVHFGKQLRDRRLYPRDVLTSVGPEDVLPVGYVRCLTGGDVGRWSTNWSGLALLDSEEARRGGCWDPDIQNARDKLITRQVGRFPVWGMDALGYQCLNTVFMVLPTDSRYSAMFLLGVLNAAPLQAYWLDHFYDQRNTFPKIKGTYLKKLPLPAPPTTDELDGVVRTATELVRLTEAIGESSGDERQRLLRGAASQEVVLDRLVADLYGLGERQREAIGKALADRP